MEGPCSLLDSPLNLLSYQASYTPLCWQNSTMPFNHNLPAPDPQASLPPLQTGDMVYLSDNPQGDLTPKWQGPFKIILLAPTADKLEVTSWVHPSHLKRVTSDPALPSLNDTYWVSLTGPTSLKFTRRQPLSTIREGTE